MACRQVVSDFFNLICDSSDLRSANNGDLKKNKKKKSVNRRNESIFSFSLFLTNNIWKKKTRKKKLEIYRKIIYCVSIKF